MPAGVSTSQEDDSDPLSFVGRFGYVRRGAKSPRTYKLLSPDLQIGVRRSLLRPRYSPTRESSSRIREKAWLSSDGSDAATKAPSPAPRVGSG